MAAIDGHVPSKMVRCLSTFMELCYIFCRNVISNTALKSAESLLQKFHELRLIFIDEGVRESISLPRQHALPHYLTSVPLFGAANGLCSSITESKHIKAVKEPWRRSSRFKALIQMLRTIIRLEKLAALRRRFKREGMLNGSTASHFNITTGCNESQISLDEDGDIDDVNDDEDAAAREKGGDERERLCDVGPESGPQSHSSITLAATSGMFFEIWIFF